MPGKFSLYQDLSVKRKPRILLPFLLPPSKKLSFNKRYYSQICLKTDVGHYRGYEAKVILSCAMIPTPEILFLDEPISHVVSRIEF